MKASSSIGRLFSVANVSGAFLVVAGPLWVIGPRLSEGFDAWNGLPHKIIPWETLLFDPVRIGWGLFAVVAGSLLIWSRSRVKPAVASVPSADRLD